MKWSCYRNDAWIVILVLVMGSLFASFVPPLQSPDETTHIKRAYFLSKGTILLDAPPGMRSGGYIDSGLEAYIAFYAEVTKPSKRDKKLSSEEMQWLGDMQWTGQQMFSPAAGAGYYLPFIYLPQAIGLAVGEQLHLGVDTSYRLARFLSLLAVALILCAAFRLYNTNPAVVAMLLLPMTVYQFSSASLDAVSTALAILAIAAFLRIASRRERCPASVFYALAIAVVLVAGARMHMLTMLVLLFFACLFTRQKVHWLVLAACTAGLAIWIIVAFSTTVDGRRDLGASSSDIVMFYLRDPLALARVLINTVSQEFLLTFYRDSFLGRLGSLDVIFTNNQYRAVGLATFLCLLLSVSYRSWRAAWLPRAVLIVTALASCLLAFIAMLINWTPHPAQAIDGVQGRYFLIPALMLAYAVAGSRRPFDGVLRWLAWPVVAGIGAFTIFCSPPRLLEAYFMAQVSSAPIATTMQASPALSSAQSIQLHVSEVHLEKPQPMARLGIMLGTYGRENPGQALLRLQSTDEDVIEIPFELSPLPDNAYRFFELDGRSYISGEIEYLSGGGVSTWQAVEPDGKVATCLIYEYTSGMNRYTPGCPK